MQPGLLPFDSCASCASLRLSSLPWTLPEIDQRIGFVDIDAEGEPHWYYYLCDQVGSVLAVVNEQGQVVNQYDYDAFGNLHPDTSFENVPNRYRFHGREWDEHRGDYYYRYRCYIPEWGCFTTPDPHLNPTEPEGACNYLFCGNDPVGRIDPMGLLDVNWGAYFEYCWELGKLTLAYQLAMPLKTTPAYMLYVAVNQGVDDYRLVRDNGFGEAVRIKGEQFDIKNVPVLGLAALGEKAGGDLGEVLFLDGDPKQAAQSVRAANQGLQQAFGIIAIAGGVGGAFVPKTTASVGTTSAGRGALSTAVAEAEVGVAADASLPSAKAPKEVWLSLEGKGSQTARHTQEAGAADRILTVDRRSAAERRAAALKGVPTKPGFDRDEQPPAVFLEGGKGSSVRYIPRSDNRSAGATLGRGIGDVKDGEQVIIRIKDKE
jgi:RHS repeat-associated protein